MTDLTHNYQIDSPIIINWMSPLLFLGVLGVILFFFLSYFLMNCGVTSGAILFAYVPYTANKPLNA